MTHEERAKAKAAVLNKTCICHDLSGSATVKYGIDPEATTSVCCGPSIAYFNRVVSLKEMIDHIYGRTSVLAPIKRPHMLLRELQLYLNHFADECAKSPLSLRTREYLTEFKRNILAGIAHYYALADHLADRKARFLEDLISLEAVLQTIQVPQ
jgi:hypothetical protein